MRAILPRRASSRDVAGGGAAEARGGAITGSGGNGAVGIVGSGATGAAMSVAAAMPTSTIATESRRIGVLGMEKRPAVVR